MTRKPIQILLVPAPATPELTSSWSAAANMVMALCNDGTIWWSNLCDTSEVWQRYEHIPQDKVKRMVPPDRIERS